MCSPLNAVFDGPSQVRKMMLWRSIGIAASLMAAAETSVRPPITSSGWGPVRIGMPPAEAIAATNGDLSAGKDESASDCYYLESSREPGLGFMILEGRVVVVDASERGLSTPTGIRVGDSEARVRQLYKGRFTVKAHAYVDYGHYFVVKTGDGTRAVVIETYDGKVQAIRGGELPAVMFVEGCS